ncbi:MAG: hypothetical protein Q4D38_01850 [Planctomycetia bacterium]|nr:hypothetical protein [Planctomycetia bacterium]
MGENDWKNKPFDEWNGEDELWANLENCGVVSGSGFLRFRFRDKVYRIWESPIVYIEDENGDFVYKKEYESYEDLMEDKNWGGLSMAEILRQIKWNDFDEET